MQKSFADRAINEGFSGGEKKKSEVLQLMLLQPKLVILDEPDSGLDIDALRIVAGNLDKLRQRHIGVLVITHYFRILRYLKPDYVHVMIGGHLVRSGRRALATEVERRGFGWLTPRKGT
jgi:Fe-S cluster assembly ATP-binding protein